MAGGQAAQRVERPLDPVGRVAEDVDRRAREMGRADALGEHEHARAGLREPDRRAQPREARPDDDDVVVAHAWTTSSALAFAASASGRCSTSSRPWKIQSSSRAWRSWSP